MGVIDARMSLACLVKKREKGQGHPRLGNEEGENRAPITTFNQMGRDMKRSNEFDLHRPSDWFASSR
jgi:hypothetical protein